MKRIFALTFACLYCFLFVGCSKGSGEALPMSSSTGLLQESKNSLTEESGLHESGLTMVLHPSPSDMISCEKGMYFFVENPYGGKNILFLDYETYEADFLTETQNKKHNIPEDSSWFSPQESEGGLFPFLINDNLYVLKMATGFDPKTLTKKGDTALGYIYKMNLDGTNRYTLAKFGENEEAAYDFGMASDGTSLYLIKTIYGEAQRKQILTAINLDTGDMQDIATLPQGNNFIVGTVDDSLVIETFITPEIPAGEYGFDAAEAQFKAQSFTLCLFDVNMRDVTMLKEWMQDDIVLGGIYKDGYIYIDYELNSVCKYNFNSKQDEVLAHIPFQLDKHRTLSDGIYDGRLIFKTLPLNAPLYYNCAFNMDTHEFNEITIKVDPNDKDDTFYNGPLAENKDYFLLFNPVSDIFPIGFQLIHKQDYWNNLPNFIQVRMPDVE